MIDSLSSNKGEDSVVKLSLSPLHPRTYNSISDAIKNYPRYPAQSEETIQESVLPQQKSTTSQSETNQSDQTDKEDSASLETTKAEQPAEKPTIPIATHLSRVIAGHCINPSPTRPFHLFAMDCTSAPRPFSPTLKDRSFVHSPNPTPGNKPIALGHQYSSLVFLAEKEPGNPPWVVPLLMQRVDSENKGNEFGMHQLNNFINDEGINLGNNLVVNVADSLYSTNACRKIIIGNDNLVSIARLNSGRKVFSKPTEKQLASSKNRRKFGDKMKLNDEKTHHQPDSMAQFQISSTKGSLYAVTVDSWHNMLVRGNTDFKASEHPFTLVRVTLTDETEKTVFKRPLWLMVSGKRQRELTERMIFDSYRQRYDVEHYFRFGKQNLLLDKFQTSEVAHEENWWQLSMLSYVQLYLGRELGEQILYPWEKYPKAKKNADKPLQIASPSQTQRDFTRILEEVGTPSKVPKPRGMSLGRQEGEDQPKRLRHPIVRKAKASEHKDKNKTKGVEKQGEILKPDSFNNLLNSLQDGLSNIGMTMDEFLAKVASEVVA